MREPTAQEPVNIDGSRLSLEEMAAVARGAEVATRLPPAARERVLASREVVERLVAEETAVYGVNTGFGKLSDVRVSPAELEALQLNLVRSHACGVGPPLRKPEVRAMLLLRANVLAGGHSGVRPELPERILELLDRDVTPRVPSRGSVGASGDLAPAAHAALVLVGEGRAEVEGEVLDGAGALERAGLEPLELKAKEGIALLNGTQAMTAVGGLALLRLEALLEAADVAGAMSLEGLKGTPDPFDPVVHRLRAHPGQEASGRRLRELLRESEIRESHRTGDPRIQDAYSLRCMPQVHGTARDNARYVRGVLSVELNSATDNPLVLTDGEHGRVLSNGNFHGQPVASALDLLAMAAATVASISERRVERLLNPDLSGLPAFLAARPGLQSGFMMMQVTAASQVAEVRQLAFPASVGTIPTGAGKEDHVSMGMQAALNARDAVECLERVLAVELICAAQAVEHWRPLRAGQGVEAALARIRRVVPPLSADRALSGDIDATIRLLRGAPLAPAAD